MAREIKDEQQLAECLQAAEQYLIKSALQQVKSGEFDIGKSIKTECKDYKIETLATVKRFKKSDRFDLKIKFTRTILRGGR